MEKTRIFYGYWILVVGLISLFISNFAGFYSFGVYFKPVSAEFGWSREVTSIAFLMLFLVQAAAAPFIGKLTDRYGSKNVMTLGAVVLGFGLFLTSLANGLPIFYAGYAINGLGETFLSMISVGVLVSKWFVQKRGLAVGIAAAGVGLAGVIAAPLIGIFLIPVFGWRVAYQISALLSVVLILFLAQFVIKSGPEEIGLYPDGAKAPEMAGENKSRSSSGWSVKDALKTSTFWFILIAYFLFQMVASGTTQHLVNHFTDLGFSVIEAATALSFVGAGSMIGKFSFGVICDYLQPRYTGIIAFLLGILSYLLLITPNPSMLIIILLSVLLGLSLGGWAPVTTIMTSSNFGLRNYGTLYGVITMAMNIGLGAGPTLFGYIYDTTTTYYSAYVFSLVSLVVATVLLLFTRHTSSDQGQQNRVNTGLTNTLTDERLT